MSTYDKSGVSAAQADAARRALAALLREEANRRCAECGARGPTWASVNLGVFVCLNCSGERGGVGGGGGWLGGGGLGGLGGGFSGVREREAGCGRAGGGGAARGEEERKGGWREAATFGWPHPLSQRQRRLPPSPSIILSLSLSLRVGIHRSLGTHISKVRSATLDTWLPSQVGWAGRMGNARAATYWEARLPPGFARPAEGDMAALSAFIGAKYRCEEGG